METDRTVARFGTADVAAMLVPHLVWEPALTLVGVARFGVAEEDTAVLRQLLRVHPLAWLAAKVLVVGGLAVVVLRIDAHRDAVMARIPWFVALLGILGPPGWLLV